MSDRKYLLYDGRAAFTASPEEFFELPVLASCDSDKEARSYAGDLGAMTCYSYPLYKREGDNPDIIKEEDARHEWNWLPKSGFTDR